MKYLPISVTQWIFGNRPLENIAQTIFNLSCQGIELSGDIDETDVESIHSVLSRFHLKPVMIMPSPNEDLSNPDDKIRDWTISKVKQRIHLASLLGAPCIVVNPSREGELSPTGDRRKQWLAGVEAVRVLAPVAREKKIKLALEPVNRYETWMINTCLQAVQFLDEIKEEGVGILLDTFHATIEEADIYEAIARAGKRLFHVHLPDTNRRGLGRGSLHLSSILHALDRIEYEGFVGLEFLPPESPINPANKGKAWATIDQYIKESVVLIEMYASIMWPEWADSRK